MQVSSPPATPRTPASFAREWSARSMNQLVSRETSGLARSLNFLSVNPKGIAAHHTIPKNSMIDSSLPCKNQNKTLQPDEKKDENGSLVDKSLYKLGDDIRKFEEKLYSAHAHVPVKAEPNKLPSGEGAPKRRKVEDSTGLAMDMLNERMEHSLREAQHWPRWDEGVYASVLWRDDAQQGVGEWAQRELQDIKGGGGDIACAARFPRSFPGPGEGVVEAVGSAVHEWEDSFLALSQELAGSRTEGHRFVLAQRRPSMGVLGTQVSHSVVLTVSPSANNPPQVLPTTPLSSFGISISVTPDALCDTGSMSEAVLGEAATAPSSFREWIQQTLTRLSQHLLSLDLLGEELDVLRLNHGPDALKVSLGHAAGMGGGAYVGISCVCQGKSVAPLLMLHVPHDYPSSTPFPRIAGLAKGVRSHDAFDDMMRSLVHKCEREREDNAGRGILGGREAGSGGLRISDMIGCWLAACKALVFR